jgi:hypothetical protein
MLCNFTTLLPPTPSSLLTILYILGVSGQGVNSSIHLNHIENIRHFSVPEVISNCFGIAMELA